MSFSVLTVLGMAFLGFTLYDLFSVRMHETVSEQNEQLLDQANINLDDYLRNMRLISDSMYYSVIKNADLAEDSLQSPMTLLYEANKDYLVSVACYMNDGTLVASAPVNTEKEDVHVTDQEWFTTALNKLENVYFSTPHVQNLFDNTSFRYYWVISLSRAVELNTEGHTSRGVLVIDMNYSSIEQNFDQINSSNTSSYTYLVDGDGTIIYHPKKSLIDAGLYQENNEMHASYADSTEEYFNGEKRLVTVKTVSYTGWKIISVTPEASINMNLYDTKYFVILLVSITVLTLLVLNQIVSVQITKPLYRLTNSIKDLDYEDLQPDFYMDGNYEVESLGKTLNELVLRIRKLMDDIVVEQEEKRKSDLDALQSQINPHFLYNTLDSIVWMIEGEQYEDAIFMITQLASFFRISISRGKNTISLEDEVRHAKNYMNIQKVRYKDKFEVEFCIDPEILKASIVKLVIQPILENAIYYAAESLDGDGEILVKGYRKEEDIYIEVTDNGMGMTEEVVSQLLVENNRVRKKGSGVGLINVHKRIQIRFGQQYGLQIRSTPDIGTTVTIHIPYVPYQGESSLPRTGRGGETNE